VAAGVRREGGDFVNETSRRFDPVCQPLDRFPLLIEASAGTGKTWSLTALATRLVVEGRVASIDRLLLVTFTVAATHELRERLRTRLQDTRNALMGCKVDDDFVQRLVERCDDRALARDRVLRALRDFDEARVSTIHGFCARVLQDSAFEAGLVFETDETQDSDFLRQVAVADAWRAQVQAGPPWRAAWLAEKSYPPRKEGRGRDLYADLETRLQYDGAEFLPAVESSVDDADREVRGILAGLLDDPGFLESLREAVDTVEQGLAGRHRARFEEFRRIVDEGALADDETTWSVLMGLLPGRIEKTVGTKPLKNEVWKAVVDRLEPLESSLERGFEVLRRALLESAARRFAAAKQAANLRDFDDMIGEVHDRLIDPDTRRALRNRIRGSIDAALVDEFQDTDIRQWTIFETLFTDAPLILVGDPKQAIYGFRGADVFAYLRARDAARATTSLPGNHRSHPDLVETVNALFTADGAFALDDLQSGRVQAEKSAEALSIGDGRPAVEWIRIDADGAREFGGTKKDDYRRASCARVVEHTQRLLRSRVPIDGERVHPGHVAVLTRSHAQSREMQDTFREAGIDAIVRGSGDVRATDVVAEAGAVLEAVLDPTDTRRVRTALATRLWGAPLSRLTGLEHDERAMADVVVELEALRERWRRRGAFDVLSSIVAEREVEVRWLSERDGERDVTDLRHAMEWIHGLETERGLRPEGTVAALWSERDGDENDVTRLRLERDERAVKIVTAHASKGLQYPVVFVPFAWEDRPARAPWVHHDPDDRTRVTVDWRTVDADDACRERAVVEGLSEELRLLYVAMTRAERRCVVVDTDFTPRSVEKAERRFSPLHWLLHRPARAEGESTTGWVARALDVLKAEPGSGSRHEELRRLNSCEAVRAEAEPTTADADDVGELRARVLPADVRGRLVPWYVSSFTRLTRDVDPSVPPEVALAEHDDPAVETTAAVSASVPEGIFAFARGPRAGDCLHEILEHSDFGADPADPDHRDRVRRILENHDMLRPAAHAADIDPLREAVDLVARVGRERVPGEDFELARVDAAHRANEWNFRLPVDHLDLPRLARALRDHAPRDIADGLVDELMAQPGRQEGGLFGGIVDLVFEHEGRWFLIDWKSNHLGDDVDDYHPDAVHRAMIEHAYHLQLLLYQVALHRHLSVRLRDYDYDRHCAGGAYVFLRGLCGRPDRGWVRWRPDRALVGAVDACFAVAAVEGGAR